MLSQASDLLRLAVGFDIFGFVVRTEHMPIHLGHFQHRRRQRQLGHAGMLQIEVDRQSVDVAAAVPVGLVELVESLMKRLGKCSNEIHESAIRIKYFASKNVFIKSEYTFPLKCNQIRELWNLPSG